MASIPNVDVGESSCRAQLSTTGVFTCLAIVAYLNDETTFVYHISPGSFNLDSSDINKVAQRIIEKSIRHLNRCKAKNSTLKDVFIIKHKK